uniref:PID domain-containing protein n=1 Tax=Romanomermis culicivorax TaxID=13658 RepID=A0A915JUB3_ROMCU
MNSVSKWVQNVNSTLRRTSSTSSNAGSAGNASYNRSWIHSPDDLSEGVVKYTVKFMGDVAVDRPKGTDMIKDAIRRIVDMPKIELHISVKGVKMVDAKSHLIRQTLPLHKISFCADDKHDKRLFAFIAKINIPSGSATTKGACQSEEHHRCFVFLSDRLAEQITLTIGEAFDLAYRQFLDSNNKAQPMTNGANSTISRSTINRDGSSQMKKLVDLLRKRIQELERENADLKQQLAQFQRSMAKNTSVDDGAYLKPKWESFDSLSSTSNGALILNEDPELPPLPSSPIPIPPPPQELPRIIHSLPKKKAQQSDASKLSNMELMKDLSAAPAQQQLTNKVCELLFDREFDPRAGEVPIEFSKLEIINSSNKNEQEMTNEQLACEIQRNEALLAEMREGYKRGLTFGHEDFTSGGEACFILDDQQQQQSTSADDPFK